MNLAKPTKFAREPSICMSRICDESFEKTALHAGCWYQFEAKAMSLRRKIAPPQRLSQLAQRPTTGELKTSAF